MSFESAERLLVRIVNVDYYLSKPVPSLKDPCYSGFRSLPVSYVPVIRLFGPTSSGIKTCVHIHNVFPYIFVPNWNSVVSEKDLYHFANVLDKAINTSFANSAAKTCHVHRITAVLGRPFYGFYEDEKQFLKIEFFNPAIVKRAAELLQNGAVFCTAFQPHEAHVPYILQFFIDNTLYGMNFIALSSYSSRSPEDGSEAVQSQQTVNRQSCCALEIDVTVENIVNVHEGLDNMPPNPGLAFIWEEEKRRRRMQNEPSQITLSLSQDRPVKPLSRSEVYFQNKMVEKLRPHKNPSPFCTESFIEGSPSSNVDDVELNTQSRSVLSLLEKLIEEKEENRARSSTSSSPSMVYSDNEEEINVDASQPILKLIAENDSILGNNFSDNEIDDMDHFELSQSFAAAYLHKMPSSDESDAEKSVKIPQLDGATSPKLPRRRVSKSDCKSKKAYNLRSKNARSVAFTDRGIRLGNADAKPSPRKHYPQLQIDTQKSPKFVTRHQASHTRDGIATGTSFSASVQASDSSSNSNIIDDGSRSDFRRPYPQLGINIKKSPRAISCEENRKSGSRLRKRKIDFSDQKTLSSSESFDMSSVTIKWKKPRLKRAATVVEDESKSIDAVDSDLNSQKYSLKMRFTDDELAERLYSDLLMRKPVVKLKRINFDREPNVCMNVFEPSDLDETNSKNLAADAVLIPEVEMSQNETELKDPCQVIEMYAPNDRLAPKSIQRKRLGMRMNSRKKEDPVATETKEINVGEQSYPINRIDFDRCEIEINKFVKESQNNFLETAEFCNDMHDENIDLRKRCPCSDERKCEIGSASSQRKVVEFNKTKLLCHDGRVDEENASKVVIVDENKTFRTSNEFNNFESVDVLKPCSKDENLANIRIPKSDLVDKSKILSAWAEDSVIEIMSSSLKDVEMKKSKCSDENIVRIITVEDNVDEKNLKNVGISKTDESAQVEKRDFIDGDKQPSTFRGDSIIELIDVDSDRSSCNSVNSLVDASKSSPSIVDIDADVVVKNKEHRSNIISSVTSSDFFVERRPQHNRKASDGIATRLNFVMEDQEIDRIALSIINETINAENISCNDAHKFTHIPNSDKGNRDCKAIEKAVNKTDCEPNSADEIEVCSSSSGGESNNFASDDELILSDDDVSVLATNVEVAAAPIRTSLDETIKFTELDGEELVFNNEKLTDTATKANKASDTSLNECSVSCVNEPKRAFRMDGSCPVSSSVKMNESVIIKAKSDESSRRSTATERLRRDLVADVSANASPAAAERVLHCEIECGKEVVRSCRPVKSLGWSTDEFDDAPCTSVRTDRSEERFNIFNARRSMCSAAIFSSAVDLQNDFETTFDGGNAWSADTVIPTTSGTRELFSHASSSPDQVSNAFKVTIVSQPQMSNECEEIEQIYSGSSNSDNYKNRVPGYEEDGKATGYGSTFNTLPASKIDYKFDNSIWYSSDEEHDDEENRVCSLYKNDSISSREVTLFAERSDSPAGDDQAICSNERQILSTREASGVGLSSGIRSPDTVSPTNKGFISDDSPTDLKKGRRLMHSSTPTGRRMKKSPSPSYTPIYKRLMLKVLGEEEKKCGRAEVALEGIREEVETSNVLGTSMNNSTTKSDNADESKSPNAGGTVNSVGSGRIEATMNDTFGFKTGLDNLQDVKVDVQYQFITVMSMELFVETRLDLNPDPEYDAISCIFYSIFHDVPNVHGLTTGMIIVDAASSKLDLQKFPCHKQFVQNEDELFDLFVDIIRKYDPDIFLGYEIEMLSWGFLIQRGQHRGRNCYVELSRVKEKKIKEYRDKSVVEDGDYSNELKLVGRIVLNVWRLMRHEIALQSYSFENILFHVMHQRVPKYSCQSLTQWWRNSLRRWLVVDYYIFRVENDILILQQLDFFGKTSELAKLFGIQFFEVLSRGSQFRVESIMLRLAKTQNFVAMSPSPRQRASMRAPESLPLIMEPESKYYTEPVIVLDFQSLYPSIIIAYNYCFSTCLGRVQHLVNNETFEFGCAEHTVPIDLLLRLESSLNLSPCGVAFVNQSVRRGILPAMLQEILETRLMVKKSMKQNKDNKILQRVLHARQLGLKLIANVTYGYTSANFSGRMPCIEIGDSVVSKGRETLERAIEMISNNENWEAKVVYGDTDSLFVLVPGRSKEDAFRIGSEIVEAVTNANPKPVKLKLEKVYYPCLLQTKKRYVGYMYESAGQKEPVYDAKGIETVRRDGCPAVSKILEKSLKLLFETNDVDTVKRYVQHQFSKIVSGRLSIQELTFAREYRGMNNYKPAACVPALQLAKQALMKDRRAEPRVKERVRYILTAGPPNVPLIRLVRTPEQLLSSPGGLINAEYYITRAIIPALERCFALLRVNVQNWYTELPRKKQLILPVPNDIHNRPQKKKTLFQYFASSKCISCGGVTTSSICKQCVKKPQELAIILGNLINAWQRKHNYVSKICRSCSACSDIIDCTSLDCSIFYNRHQAQRDAEQVSFIEELQHKYLRLNVVNRN